MCITGLSCKNYKSLKDVSAEFKPITIFSGTNGVGKTNFMTLLLLLKHGIKKGRYKHAALRLEGMDNNIRADQVKKLFRNYDINKPIKLSFTFRKQNDFSNVVKKVFEDIQSSFKSDFLYLENIFGSDTNFIPGIIGEKHSLKSIIDDLKFWAFQYSIEPDEYRIEKENIISFLKRINKEEEELDDVLYLIKLIEGFHDSVLQLGFSLKTAKLKNENDQRIYQTLIMDEIYLNADNKSLIRIKLVKHKGKNIYKISSEWDTKNIIKEKYETKLFQVTEERMDLQDLGNNKKSIIESDSLFVDLLMLFVKQSFRVLKEYLSSPNSISFLPAERKLYTNKYSFYIGKNKIKTEGAETVDILKNNIEIRTKVNNWLKPLDHEVLFDSKDRIRIRYKNSIIDFDITDAGSAIAVILPVLVRILSAPKDSISLIEHPELHLHPKMRTCLADFIINNFQRDRIIILETHSYLLINRFKSRMLDPKDDKLNFSDINMYNFTSHIGDDGEMTSITKMNNKNNGLNIPTEFSEEPRKDVLKIFQNLKV